METVQEVARQEHQLGFDQFRRVASLLGGHSPSGNARQDVTSSSATDHPRIPKVSFVAGAYSGTVHNQTVDQSAEFVIVARSDAGNVAGCMGVVKPLIGSGPLHGQVKGSTITFTVNADGFDLFFRGNIANDKITGTYAVSPINGVVQEGGFSLKRADSKVPPSDSVQHCPTDAEMNDH
jgi:hypothetical protein